MGALGQLGQVALRLGLIQNSLTPSLHKPCLLIFAGDHGIADVFDGFGGGWQKAQILAIMKDSRVGTYGTVSSGAGIRLNKLRRDSDTKPMMPS